MSEKQRRIKVAVAAYLYEVCDLTWISDAEFDALCLTVDVSQETGNPVMDQWFKDNFDPSTGMWVHIHPDQKGLHRIARSFFPELPRWD